jgi:hypothetical protein
MTSSANQLRVMSLDETVAKSEVVVIGTVTAIDLDANTGAYAVKYALVEVVQTLKGLPAGTIKVEYRGPLPEENPACCSVGKSYLLFLRKSRDAIYVSVNHGFGVYNLTDVK